MSINFNDLPCDIMRMIFAYNRRNAHLEQIRNRLGSPNQAKQLQQLRASGYVYDDKFIWMDEYCGPYSQNVLGKIQLKYLSNDLSERNVSRTFINGDYDDY